MHEDDPRFAHWFEQSQDQRDHLDAIARDSILELAGYPFWDLGLCAELVGWLTLEREVAEAYADWLARGKARAERHGREWDHAEVLRQERMHEAGD